MLNYNLFLQHFCAFAAFGTGPVQTSYDRFLAVLTGPGPGPLSSGNFKDRSGHRSVKNRVKKPNRTGPLSTIVWALVFGFLIFFTNVNQT